MLDIFQLSKLFCVLIVHKYSFCYFKHIKLNENQINIYCTCKLYDIIYYFVYLWMWNINLNIQTHQIAAFDRNKQNCFFLQLKKNLTPKFFIGIPKESYFPTRSFEFIHGYFMRGVSCLHADTIYSSFIADFIAKTELRGCNQLPWWDLKR